MRRARLAIVVALAATVAGLAAAPLVAGAVEAGFVDASYAGATAPTGQKPQSKLWHADGRWWGTLFNSATGDFEIYRYTWSTHTWATTGVVVDERQSSFLDALWTGDKLYVATAGTSTTTSAHAARVVRFSYDTATGTWSRDTGFPVTITNGGVKAIVIDQDSAGVVWITYTGANRVRVAHSTDGRTWTAPEQLPFAEAAGLTSEEISSVVAYDGNKIGVAWSDQTRGAIWFATHQDGAAFNQWTLDVIYQRPEGSDDHLNLKALVADPTGRVLAVSKTSLNASADPLIVVHALAADGQWRSAVYGRVTEQHTRAVLAIDATNRVVHVFAAAPCCSGGVIYHKQSPIDALSFPPGLGTPFIASAAHPEFNNPTTTKQPVTAATGLVVMASDDQTRFYGHNRIDLGAPPVDTVPPTVVDTSPAAGAVDVAPAAVITATFSEALDPATVTPSTATLEAGGGGSVLVDATVEYVAANRQIRLTPGQPLAPGTYTARLRGGTGGIRDVAGNPLATTASWSFSVSPPSTSFTDGFEGGLGAWTTVIGGDGTAAVVAGAGTNGSAAAALTSTSNSASRSQIVRSLSTGAPDAVVEAAVRWTVNEPNNKSVPFLRLAAADGTELVSLFRRGGSSSRLQVESNGTRENTAVVLPINAAYRVVTVRLIGVGAGTGQVEVAVDGVVAYRSTVVRSGLLRTVAFGSDWTRNQYRLLVDDVTVELG